MFLMQPLCCCVEKRSEGQEWKQETSSQLSRERWWWSRPGGGGVTEGEGDWILNPLWRWNWQDSLIELMWCVSVRIQGCRAFWAEQLERWSCYQLRWKDCGKSSFGEKSRWSVLGMLSVRCCPRPWRSLPWLPNMVLQRHEGTKRGCSLLCLQATQPAHVLVPFPWCHLGDKAWVAHLARLAVGICYQLVEHWNLLCTVPNSSSEELRTHQRFQSVFWHPGPCWPFLSCGRNRTYWQMSIYWAYYMQGPVVDKTAEGRQTELEGTLAPVGAV